MDSRLVHGLEGKDLEHFTQEFTHSQVRERLHKIISDLIKEKEAPPVSDYDSPSWAFKQADRNGEMRTLNKVLKILTL